MATDSEMLLRILGKFERVDERFDKLEGDIAELKIGQARLESSVGRLENRAERVESRLGRVERKVDAIAGQTAHFMEFETEARMRLDRLEAARVSAK
jgi:archaellum component FlaC